MDVFYLNTNRFLHDGFIKVIFLMDFKFCLLAPCSESPSLAMQKFRDNVIAHAHSVRNGQFSVTKNSIMAPAGKALSLRIF